MEKQEVESYFCLLTDKICAGGVIKWGTTTKNCVFRATDTIPSGQCRLMRVMSTLEKFKAR